MGTRQWLAGWSVGVVALALVAGQAAPARGADDEAVFKFGKVGERLYRR